MGIWFFFSFTFGLKNGTTKRQTNFKSRWNYSDKYVRMCVLGWVLKEMFVTGFCLFYFLFYGNLAIFLLWRIDWGLGMCWMVEHLLSLCKAEFSPPHPTPPPHRDRAIERQRDTHTERENCKLHFIIYPTNSMCLGGCITSPSLLFFRKRWAQGSPEIVAQGPWWL